MGDVLDKVATAKPYEDRSDFFEADAEWLLMIDKVRRIETRKKKHFFVIEARILESSLPTVRPGVSRAYFLDIYSDYADRDLATIGKAAKETLEVSDEIDGDFLRSLYSEDQPLATAIMALKTNFNKAKTFTVHRFRAPTSEERSRGEAKAVELGLMQAPKKVAAK